MCLLALIAPDPDDVYGQLVDHARRCPTCWRVRDRLFQVRCLCPAGRELAEDFAIAELLSAPAASARGLDAQLSLAHSTTAHQSRQATATAPQCRDCGPLDYDEVGEDEGPSFCGLCGEDLQPSGRELAVQVAEVS